MALTGGAGRKIAPPGHRAQIDLTITDDLHAQAIVIISAVKD